MRQHSKRCFFITQTVKSDSLLSKNCRRCSERVRSSNFGCSGQSVSLQPLICGLFRVPLLTHLENYLFDHCSISIHHDRCPGDHRFGFGQPNACCRLRCEDTSSRRASLSGASTYFISSFPQIHDPIPYWEREKDNSSSQPKQTARVSLLLAPFGCTY